MTTTRDYAPPATDRARGAAELARLIADGELTASTAVEEQIRRVEAWHPHLNAVVVPMFERARAAARAADDRQRRGEPVGPLHGVPITIKESFDIAGTPSTVGLERLREHRAERTSLLVQRLEEAGAIVLGKTNVPELLVYYESDNPCYGRTANPWNLERTPGGSSGGEAAVVASGGSPLGLGSDIGGSIRVPAHYCGVHGLKPTSGRLTMRGFMDDELFPGQEAVFDQAGPFARNIEDLTLAMSVLAAPGQERWDESIAPVPWRDPGDVRLPGLRVGVYVDDGVIAPAPAVRRAVREASEVLRGAGIELLEFAPPDVPHALRLYFQLLSADGARWGRRLLGSGRHDRRVADLLRLSSLSSPLRMLLCSVLRAGGQRRLADLISRLGALDTAGYWSTVAERSRYRRRFLASMDAQGLDAILCPPNAHPAMRHGASYYLTSLGSYAMLYNLLGMPAGVAAFTRVASGEESERGSSRDLVERTLKQTEVGSAGLPVGVQLVARHWREDIVLALMAAVESGARLRPDYPLRSLPPLPA